MKLFFGLLIVMAGHCLRFVRSAGEQRERGWCDILLGHLWRSVDLRGRRRRSEGAAAGGDGKASRQNPKVGEVRGQGGQ